MAETKVTRKVLFERVKEVMADDVEVVEMCEKYIEQLSKPRKTRVNQEAIDFANAVATHLAEAEGPKLNKELAAEMEVSPQKMAAALKRLVEQETVIRIDGEKAKDAPTFVLA